MALNRELLAILACPTCKSGLDVTEQEEGLLCPTCKVVYPVREEIPVMLVEEAVSLDLWEQGRRSVKDKS